MVRSELLQKMCNLHPNILRRDVEKIFETIVAKETDKSASILSKVMAKSDDATISSVINNITEKNSNEDS